MIQDYDPETLPIGVLGRPHGLRGELALRPHNAGSRDLGGLTELILEQGGARVTRRLQAIRRSTDGWLVRFVGIDSRTDAEPLTNVPVRVRRAALPPLREGEFFVADTVGCEVRTTEGRRLGQVADVFWNGAHDVLQVKGEGELLSPAVPTYLQSFDGAARVVVVAWEGEDEVESASDE